VKGEFLGGLFAFEVVGGETISEARGCGGALEGRFITCLINKEE
jgi:hypothetical protein